MITYNDIYEAARKERYAEQLQKLSKDFVQDVKNYLNEKRGVASKEDSGFSDVIAQTRKQIENAETLFKELTRIRRKKLLNLVLIAAETGISKQDFDNMLDFEKELFEDLMKSIESSDKKLSQIMNAETEKPQKEEIVFKEDVGEFVGLDGKKIGPFKKDEKTELPKEIAKILVDDNKADVVKG